MAPIADSQAAHDQNLGVAVIDAFTLFILKYLETLTKTSKATLYDLFNTYDPARIYSHPGVSTELSSTPTDEILITDFFGGVAGVEVTPSSARLDPLRSRGSWQVGKRNVRGLDRSDNWTATYPLSTGKVRPSAAPLSQTSTPAAQWISAALIGILSTGMVWHALQHAGEEEYSTPEKAKDQ